MCLWGLTAGCGSTEGTNAADAVAALDPSGEYVVTDWPVDEADTNAVRVAAFSIRASSTAAGFDLAVTDNNGLSYAAQCGAAAVAEPDAGNDYAAGALVAEFPVSGAALAGTIRVLATQKIAMAIERRTNETGAVTTRQGVHTIGSGNARYVLEGMCGTNAFAAGAAAQAGTICW